MTPRTKAERFKLRHYLVAPMIAESSPGLLQSRVTPARLQEGDKQSAMPHRVGKGSLKLKQLLHLVSAK